MLISKNMLKMLNNCLKNVEKNTEEKPRLSTLSTLDSLYILLGG